MARKMGFHKGELLNEIHLRGGYELSHTDIQDILFDMLKEFDSFCRNHNIRYFIMWGTLIGAIRHKGFIPWDDDIDIFMERKEFQKLISHDQITQRYQVVSFGKAYDYYYPFLHGNIVDKSTVMVGDNIEFCTGKGLSIDIIPIDAVPEDRYSQKVLIDRFMKKRRFVDLLHSKRFDNSAGVKQIIKKTVAKCLFFCDEFKALERINTMALEADKMYHSSTCSNLVLDVPIIYSLEDFIEPVEVEFNGIKVYAPKNYDTLLRKIYGNYMEIPPIEERYNHTMKVFCRYPFDK